jgi:hypothetical protein
MSSMGQDVTYGHRHVIYGVGGLGNGRKIEQIESDSPYLEGVGV